MSDRAYCCSIVGALRREAVAARFSPVHLLRAAPVPGIALQAATWAILAEQLHSHQKWNLLYDELGKVHLDLRQS